MEGWDDKMGEKNHDPTTILTIHHAPIPSGKHTKNDGKSQFLMGKSTISMAMFNSFLLVYQAGYPKS
jgi:hypothetical protein